MARTFAKASKIQFFGYNIPLARMLTAVLVEKCKFSKIAPLAQANMLSIFQGSPSRSPPYAHAHIALHSL